MTDYDLKQTIIDALDFEPSLDATSIGVAVQDGVVTLSGHVPTYPQKVTAEQVTLRIKGVRGLAEDLEVRPTGAHLTADDEIARRIADSLRWAVDVPVDAVRARVSGGHVTLEGEVEWNYQREAAARLSRTHMGVKSINNQVRISPRTSPGDVRGRIEKALKRDAELDAAGIRIEVRDGTVTLEGRVDCWADRALAESAAWAAPGVTRVEDRLRVA